MHTRNAKRALNSGLHPRGDTSDVPSQWTTEPCVACIRTCPQLSSPPIPIPDQPSSLTMYIENAHLRNCASSSGRIAIQHVADHKRTAHSCAWASSTYARFCLAKPLAKWFLEAEPLSSHGRTSPERIQPPSVTESLWLTDASRPIGARTIEEQDRLSSTLDATGTLTFVRKR